MLDPVATLAAAEQQEQLRNLLETQRALLVGVIRRFESARGLVPIRFSDQDWTGPARKSFDHALDVLTTQLDDAGRALERAQVSMVDALADLVGRVG